MSGIPLSWSKKPWNQQTWSERLTFTFDNETISQVLIPRLHKIQYAKIVGVSLLALALLSFFIWATVTALPLAIFSAISLEMLAAFGVLLAPFISGTLIAFMVVLTNVKLMRALYLLLLPLACLSALTLLPASGVLVAGSSLFTACILLVSAAALSLYLCCLIREHLEDVLEWLGLLQEESFLIIIFVVFNLILFLVSPYLSFAITSTIIGCNVLLASLLILGMSGIRMLNYYDHYKHRHGSSKIISGVKMLFASLCFFGLLSFILWAAISSALPLAIVSGITLHMLVAFAVIVGPPLVVAAGIILEQAFREYVLIVPAVILAVGSLGLLVSIPACGWLIAGSSFGTACVLLLAALIVAIGLCILVVNTDIFTKFLNFFHIKIPLGAMSIILPLGFLLFNLLLLPSLIVLPATVSHLILGCCVLNGVLLLLAISGIKIMQYCRHIDFCKQIQTSINTSHGTIGTYNG